MGKLVYREAEGDAMHAPWIVNTGPQHWPCRAGPGPPSNFPAPSVEELPEQPLAPKLLDDHLPPVSSPSAMVAELLWAHPYIAPVAIDRVQVWQWPKWLHLDPKSLRQVWGGCQSSTHDLPMRRGIIRGRNMQARNLAREFFPRGGRFHSRFKLHHSRLHSRFKLQTRS